MKKCPLCAEEIADEAIKCKHCGSMLTPNHDRHPGAHANATIVQPHQGTVISAPDSSVEAYAPNTHVKEFRRTCEQCGNAWSVAEERIQNLETTIRSYARIGLTQAGSNLLSAKMAPKFDATQTMRNQDALKSELLQLNQCPSCGSSNFKQDVVVFKRKHHQTLSESELREKERQEIELKEKLERQNRQRKQFFDYAAPIILLFGFEAILLLALRSFLIPYGIFEDGTVAHYAWGCFALIWMIVIIVTPVLVVKKIRQYRHTGNK